MSVGPFSYNQVYKSNLYSKANKKYFYTLEQKDRYSDRQTNININRKTDIVKLCRNKQQPRKTFFRHAK